MKPFLLVCAGGAIGSGARYLAVVWATRLFGAGFPAGTLLVNLGGSFLMGLLMELAMRAGITGSQLPLFLGSGVLGGFTTYSAFNYETTGYLRDGAIAVAFVNIAATLLGCLAAGALGLFCARLIIPD